MLVDVKTAQDHYLDRSLARTGWLSFGGLLGMLQHYFNTTILEVLQQRCNTNPRLVLQRNHCFNTSMTCCNTCHYPEKSVLTLNRERCLSTRLRRVLRSNTRPVQGYVRRLPTFLWLCHRGLSEGGEYQPAAPQKEARSIGSAPKSHKPREGSAPCRECLG